MSVPWTISGFEVAVGVSVSGGLGKLLLMVLVDPPLVRLVWPLLTAYPQNVRGISLEEPPY